jgi:peptidoglycan/LPS O-acetylase OafA/YrhL
LACLAVLYGHLFEGFAINIPHYLTLCNYLVSGQFAVGLFFLISGFVIPLSLEKLDSKTFLIQRFFRLYPCLFFMMLVIGCFYLIAPHLNWATWGILVPISKLELLSNFLLMPDLIFAPLVVPVMWTLFLEIKFYLLTAGVKSLVGLHAHRFLITSISILLLFFIVFRLYAHYEGLSCLSQVLRRNACILTYMYIGTVFYFWYKNQLTFKQFIFWGIFLFTLSMTFASSHHIFALADDPLKKFIFTRRQEVFSLTSALLFFISIYYYRNKLAYSSLLNFIADISYPLYLVHQLVKIPILIDFFSPKNELLHFEYFVIWTFLAVGLAYLLHKYVEMPFNRYGKTFRKTQNPALISEEKLLTNQ